MESSIAVFRGKEIRKIIHNNEWWFSVVDVIAVLTDSVNPRDYWFKMKIREKGESGIELSTICRQLKLIAPDGKSRETDCANTEGGGERSRRRRNRTDGGGRLTNRACRSR